MKSRFLSTALLLITLNVSANDVQYIGPNSVVPDALQKEMIASSVIALVRDCTVATKIGKNETKLVERGLEVNFTRPVTFNAHPAGKVNNINKVVVRLWENAEENFGMDIYAYNDSEVYLLGKYMHLAYPIINMVIRPMPPNKAPQSDATKRHGWP